MWDSVGICVYSTCRNNRFTVHVYMYCNIDEYIVNSIKITSILSVIDEDIENILHVYVNSDIHVAVELLDNMLMQFTCLFGCRFDLAHGYSYVVKCHYYKQVHYIIIL